MTYLIQLAYLIATGLFVFSLHWMNGPRTARRGVLAGAAAMLMAVIGTLLQPGIVNWQWIGVAVACGFVVGVPLSWVPLTAVPQRTALSHAFGGLAAGLVGTAEYYLWLSEGSLELTHFRMTAIIAEIILGFLTFTGSLVAAGKLQEIAWIPQRPWVYRGQNIVNLSALGLAFLLGVLLVVWPTSVHFFFPVVILLALAFGVMLVLPIGGADMPTVISILNSYAGLSAVAMGFVLDNKLLITAGALDGSSGLILSIIMCRAMNRSFANVLFGAFGRSVAAGPAPGEARIVRQMDAEEAAMVLEAAQKVFIIPGYGMAVAQAQHAVAELAQLLVNKGTEVKFGVHPVAGRMPGHMNVLLAEANVPYERLADLELNSEMEQCDVALVIGANDVVNPDARRPDSQIAGMPIFDVDKARTVMVCKRSLNPGFAGIENPLFFNQNTVMLFGDAKKMVGAVVSELKGV